MKHESRIALGRAALGLLAAGISLLMQVTRTMQETLKDILAGELKLSGTGAISLLDKPQSSALRQQHRPEHKAYLGAVAHRIAFAGPLMADDGESMLGSLLVIDFDSREAVHEWLAREPFTRAGLYASVSVHPFVNLWPQKAGFPAAS